MEPAQEGITLRSIFNCLNESEKEVYIAIDEFQQIAEYPENGVMNRLYETEIYAYHYTKLLAYI